MKSFLTLSKRNIIIAAVVLAGLLFYMLSGGSNSGEGDLSYRTKTVETGNIFRSVAASGSINALVEVDVGSQLSGQIKELYADFNDEVSAGKLIALIEPEMFEMRLGQREAELAVSEADLLSRKAQLESDLSAAALMEREVERQQRLFEGGNLSTSAIDTVKTNAKQAQNRVAISRAAVTNAEAVVLQRKSAVTQAKIELDRTEIRAPIDGVVIERSVDVGQTVAASMQAPVLFRIANDLKDVRVEASVDEADIGQVKAGQDVRFTVDAYPDKNFMGRVEEVRLAPTIAQNVVTYTVTILASNNDMSLLPGMTANVEITTGNRQDIIRVSNEALRFKPRNGEEGDTAENAGGPPSPEVMVARMVDPVAKEIGLNDDQKSKLEDGLKPVLSAGLAAAQNGGGFGALRGTLTQAMTSLIDDIATPEQRQAYADYQKRMQAERAGRSAGKRAEVWVLDNGELKKRTIMIGISDTENTEVLRGLKAGDLVVTGYERLRTE